MKSNPTILSSLVCIFAACTAVLHGQEVKTATAAEAPTTEVAKAPSSWLLGLSYDYYSDDVQWGGFGSIRSFYTNPGASANFGTGGKTIRSPKADGVTVSAGKGDWALDFSYREGHSSLNVPITYTAVQSGDTLTVKFADQVAWEDKIVDVRLRDTFLHVSGWAGYWSVGYFNQTTDQKVRQTIAFVGTQSLGDLTRLFNTGTTTLSGFSGNIGQQYGSAGLGLARQFKVSDGWYLALKGEGALLAGSIKAQQITGSAIDPSTGSVSALSSGANKSSTIYGGKTSGSVRLSFAATDSLTLALEGGGEYWRFFSGSSNSSKFTDGVFARAVAQFKF